MNNSCVNRCCITGVSATMSDVGEQLPEKPVVSESDVGPDHSSPETAPTDAPSPDTPSINATSAHAPSANVPSANISDPAPASSSGDTESRKQNESNGSGTEPKTAE